MSAIISRDHSLFQSRDRMKQLTRELETNFGVSYFQYLRCFNDGSVGLLLSDTSLTEYFWNQSLTTPLVYSSFKEENKQSHSYWFLWDEELPHYPVNLAREFNIFSGITLVRRSKYYYDMIAVAMPKIVDNPGSFYLNKIHGIEQFIIKFDKTEKELLSTMNKDKIALPKVHRDENYQKICLNSEQIKIKGRNGITHVTSQEMACIRLLCSGLSQKEVAQILDISPRSVETYLYRARIRTGFSLAEIKALMVF